MPVILDLKPQLIAKGILDPKEWKDRISSVLANESVPLTKSWRRSDEVIFDKLVSFCLSATLHPPYNFPHPHPIQKQNIDAGSRPLRAEGPAWRLWLGCLT